MAAGYPVKVDYVTGDVLTATNLNDLAGTVNLYDPTAKGDLFPAISGTSVGLLAVGANATVLTADSTAATGMKWAATGGSTATYVGVGVGKTANQSISNNTDTAVAFNSESFDTDGFHDNATNNSRLTIPSGKAGKYLLTGCLSWSGNSTGLRAIKIYKNGSLLIENSLFFGGPDGLAQPQSFIFNLAVADYLEIFCRQSSGGSLDVTTNTQIQMTFLGA